MRTRSTKDVTMPPIMNRVEPQIQALRSTNLPLAIESRKGTATAAQKAAAASAPVGSIAAIESLLGF